MVNLGTSTFPSLGPGPPGASGDPVGLPGAQPVFIIGKPLLSTNCKLDRPQVLNLFRSVGYLIHIAAFNHKYCYKSVQGCSVANRLDCRL